MILFSFTILPFFFSQVPIESESEIVEMYVDVVQRNRSIRAAVIDHISSQSAIRVAIQEHLFRLRTVPGRFLVSEELVKQGLERAKV